MTFSLKNMLVIASIIFIAKTQLDIYLVWTSSFIICVIFSVSFIVSIFFLNIFFSGIFHKYFLFSSKSSLHFLLHQQDAICIDALDQIMWHTL